MPLDKIAYFGCGIQIHVEDLAGRERADIMTRFHELLPAYQDLAVSLG